jgi:hypothetical protein
MSFLRNITNGLRSLFRKERVDRESDEELGAYLEMEAAEKVKQGVSRKEAIRAVRLERGSAEIAKEVIRSASWESLVETCWQDLRFGLRMLRKSPGFTALAILTFALGIGASVAIFGFVDGALLEPLPYANPDRLMSVSESNIFGESSPWPLSYPDFLDWQRLNRSLHPEDRVYTVISGVFYIGLDAEFDASKLEAYPPGAVIILPGNTPHFHWAKSGEYVTQVTAMGPLGLEYLSAKDDPRNNLRGVCVT